MTEDLETMTPQEFQKWKAENIIVLRDGAWVSRDFCEELGIDQMKIVNLTHDEFHDFIKPPIVIAHDVTTFAAEDTPDEWIAAIEAELAKDT